MKTAIAILTVGLVACGQGMVTGGGAVGGDNTTRTAQDANVPVPGPAKNSTSYEGWLFGASVPKGQTALAMAKTANINGTVATADDGMVFLGVHMVLANRSHDLCLDLASKGIVFSVGGAVYEAQVGAPQMDTCMQPQESATGLLIFQVPDTMTIKDAAQGSLLCNDGALTTLPAADLLCHTVDSNYSACQVR